MQTCNVGDQILILGSNTVAFSENGKLLGKQALDFPATSMAASQSIVCIGGDDSKVRVFQVSGTKLTLDRMIEIGQAVTAISVTKDGKYIAVGDARGRVLPYEVNSGKLLTDRWVYHSARILSLAWDEQGNRCVSGSLDTNVYVWDKTQPNWKFAITSIIEFLHTLLFCLDAHPEAVTGVAWMSLRNSIVSVGRDGCVRVWKVQ